MKDFFLKDELITVQDAMEKFGYSRDWLKQQGFPESGWISREQLESLVRESLRRIGQTWLYDERVG
jgi:hypothetical protein